MVATTIQVKDRSNPRSPRRAIATSRGGNVIEPIQVPILDRPEGQSLPPTLEWTSVPPGSNPRSPRRAIATLDLKRQQQQFEEEFQSSIAPKGNRYIASPEPSDAPIKFQSSIAPKGNRYYVTLEEAVTLLGSNPRSPRRAIATSTPNSFLRIGSLFQSSIAPKGNRYLA